MPQSSERHTRRETERDRERYMNRLLKERTRRTTEIAPAAIDPAIAQVAPRPSQGTRRRVSFTPTSELIRYDPAESPRIIEDATSSSDQRRPSNAGSPVELIEDGLHRSPTVNDAVFVASGANVTWSKSEVHNHHYNKQLAEQADVSSPRPSIHRLLHWGRRLMFVACIVLVGFVGWTIIRYVSIPFEWVFMFMGLLTRGPQPPILPSPAPGIFPTLGAVTPLVTDLGPVMGVIDKTHSMMEALAELMPELAELGASPTDEMESAKENMEKVQESASQAWCAGVQSEMHTSRNLLRRLGDLKRDVEAGRHPLRWFCHAPLVGSWLKQCDAVKRNALSLLAETMELAKEAQHRRLRYSEKDDVGQMMQDLSKRLCKLDGMLDGLDETLRRCLDERDEPERVSGPVSDSEPMSDSEPNSPAAQETGLTRSQEAKMFFDDQREGLRLSCHFVQGASEQATGMRSKLADDVDALRGMIASLMATKHDVEEWDLLSTESALGRIIGELNGFVDRLLTWDVSYEGATSVK